jgi:hypothetical protein
MLFRLVAIMLGFPVLFISAAQQQLSGAKETVESFMNFEVAGGRLGSADAQIEPYFAKPVALPVHPQMLVIGSPYTVWEPIKRSEIESEVNVEIVPKGQIDSALRFRASSQRYYKSSIFFRLILVQPQSGPSVQQTAGCERREPSWKIAEPDKLVVLKIEAAVKYLEKERDKTSDAKLKQNATRSIEDLRKLE